MTFSAIGQTADGVLRVQSIEIQRAGDAASLQRIDGLATETPWSDASPGLELIDMNFDDHADLRLIEARPAGPNVPYLNWLYDPASGRFVANALLDSLGAPTFDAAAREIRSEWRDSAARYGTDTYGVKDGQPLPLKREARTYLEPGVYTLEVSTWADGAWKVVDTRPGRDR